MNIDLHEPIPGAPNFSYRELSFTTHREWLQENRQIPTMLQPAGILIAQRAQAIRDHYGRPVLIHSGYRCTGLNIAIGGSKNSQHVLFQAIDFHVLGVPLSQVFQWIWHDSGLAFGQLIAEGWDPDNGDMSWIHMSLGHPYRAEEKSQQVLTMSTKRRKEGGKAFKRLQ